MLGANFIAGEKGKYMKAYELQPGDQVMAGSDDVGCFACARPPSLCDGPDSDSCNDYVVKANEVMNSGAIDGLERLFRSMRESIP
jgi:hypothetical protein